METRNLNLIRCKVKSYQNILKAAQVRTRSLSSVSNLATKLYSVALNREFSPRKAIKERAQTPKIDRKHSQELLQAPQSNPEGVQTDSPVMKGLKYRTSYVPCYAEMNTQLLRQKKQLQRKIMDMRQSIKGYNNNASQAQHRYKKNINEIEKFTQIYKDTESKNQRLQAQSRRLGEDIDRLESQISNCHQTIEIRKHLIQKLTQECDQLAGHTRNVKAALLQEQRERVGLKNSLASEQRVMTSESIRCQELQAEKAMLLIEINHSVATFKFK